MVGEQSLYDARASEDRIQAWPSRELRAMQMVLLCFREGKGREA